MKYTKLLNFKALINSIDQGITEKDLIYNKKYSERGQIDGDHWIKSIEHYIDRSDEIFKEVKRNYLINKPFFDQTIKNELDQFIGEIEKLKNGFDKITFSEIISVSTSDELVKNTMDTSTKQREILEHINNSIDRQLEIYESAFV